MMSQLLRPLVFAGEVEDVYELDATAVNHYFFARLNFCTTQEVQRIESAQRNRGGSQF
jgi:hypothetical protein